MKGALFHTLSCARLCAFVACLGSSQAQAGSNLLVNGDFEQGPAVGQYLQLTTGSTALTGWTVLQTAIDIVGTGWQHNAGDRSIDLDGSPGPGGLEQTFSTTPGQWYTVTFAMAGNPVCGSPLKSMSVSAAGQSATFSFSTTGHTVSSMGWVYESWCFKAASGASQTTLAFNSLSPTPGNCGPALDTVSVVAAAPLNPGDTNCDGHANVVDLLAVITAWGACPNPLAGCLADLNNDGTIGVADLLVVITNWG